MRSPHRVPGSRFPVVADSESGAMPCDAVSGDVHPGSRAAVPQGHALG
ncbi:hypothetical protein AB0945_03465 [Streptomyces sp. NPDC005474]